MPVDYALGHSAVEMKRLTTQAELIDPITQHFFIAAGITSGMRVLDVGSGVGDVALLLSRLVGHSGEVVGTDISEAALAIARKRIASKGLENLEFIHGDPSDMSFDKPFDAIAGRYILQFLPDPAAALRKLAALLKPGGVMVFHELDWQGCRSFPAVASYDRCCAWCAQTIGRLGAETSMGLKLHATFLAAGLRPVSVRLESASGSGTTSEQVIHLVTDLAQSLRLQLEAAGHSLETDIAFETLDADIRSDTAALRSLLIGRAEIAVWSR